MRYNDVIIDYFSLYAIPPLPMELRIMPAFSVSSIVFRLPRATGMLGGWRW
ncbi:hypothetical protein MYL53_16505 [Halomonas sp. YJPS3-2]|nr:hypothetical protein [Halomonas getboli]